MKIYHTIREKLSEDVITKWNTISGQVPSKIKKADYLTDKKTGKPQTEVNKKNWSIRDCVLNDKKVRAYIKSHSVFRGKDENEKVGQFNGYKFYQNIYLRSNDCALSYLNVYAIFLGYVDFENFVIKNEKHFKQDELVFQLERILEERQVREKSEEKEKQQKIKYLEIPPHFYALYEGYFIRPRKPKVGNSQFSKTTILLCGDNTAYMFTTDSAKNSEFEKPYYTGSIVRTNPNIMQVKFQVFDFERNMYDFSLVLDIQTRKEEEVFNEWEILRGVIVGSDPTTRKPVAGRIILKVIKLWKDLLIDSSNQKEIVSKFLGDLTFKPEDLDTAQLEKLFQKSEYKRTVIRDFFATEERYMEDINVLKKYIRNPNIYNSLIGEYFVYTLHTSGTEIRKSKLKILQLGEVYIKGKKNSNNDRRKFHGWATVLKNDVLSIIVNREIDDKETENEEIISFLLKLNFSETEDIIKPINGIRVKVSSDQSHMPIAGRVILIRQVETNFFENDDYIDSIKLFNNESKENEEELDKFSKFSDGAVANLLIGLENNIIKTFGENREKISYARDVDYKENFYVMAKHYLAKGLEELCLLNLYFSHLQGKRDIIVSLENDGLTAFTQSEYFIDNVDLDYSKKIIKNFNSNEIAFIKSSIHRKKQKL